MHHGKEKQESIRRDRWWEVSPARIEQDRDNSRKAAGAREEIQRACMVITLQAARSWQSSTGMHSA